MATKKTRTRSRWIWLSTAVGLIIIFYFVRMATRTRIPVRTAPVVRSELRSTVPTNGKVEPQPLANYEAHAPFPGIVKSIYVHGGEKVTKGELLLVMDDTDARARLATALAALRNAQDNYTTLLQGGTQQQRITLQGELTKARIDRDQALRDLAALQKLESTGAASSSEVAAAKQRLAMDNASLNVLEQREKDPYDASDLSRAKSAVAEAQAGYAAAQQAVNQANVRAPFNGTVYLIPVSRTEYVQQGDLLLEMADLSKMQVRAYFDEPEIGKLRAGQSVTIQWDAQPGRVWHGQIIRVPSTIISYTTRNVGEVLVRIDDAHDDLLPNTNVRVTALVANIPDAINVPREALHSEGGQPYVYIVSKGYLHRTPVVVGNLNLTQVQIISGLKQGQIVALGSTNGQPIGDGVPITEVR
ncbi:MAG TPA: efflux RND transporter periplasmic adaptor subunit [Acidobacteriaceae bacterium]|nr:efflux RND transporter periplasmic adaptor subunit [Acidobacteriaceae bacterium]